MVYDDDDDDEWWGLMIYEMSGDEYGWGVLSDEEMRWVMWDEMCDVGASATTRDWTEVLVMGGYKMRGVLSLKGGIA